MEAKREFHFFFFFFKYFKKTELKVKKNNKKQKKHYLEYSCIFWFKEEEVVSTIMAVFCLLLSESVLFLLAPHVHHLPVLVHLHGVIHQSVHVDELDALLLSVEQHRRDDGQLSHLLLRVLTETESNNLEWVGWSREGETNLTTSHFCWRVQWENLMRLHVLVYKCGRLQEAEGDVSGWAGWSWFVLKHQYHQLNLFPVTLQFTVCRQWFSKWDCQVLEERGLMKRGCATISWLDENLTWSETITTQLGHNCSALMGPGWRENSSNVWLVDITRAWTSTNYHRRAVARGAMLAFSTCKPEKEKKKKKIKYLLYCLLEIILTMQAEWGNNVGPKMCEPINKCELLSWGQDRPLLQT